MVGPWFAWHTDGWRWCRQCYCFRCRLLFFCWREISNFRKVSFIRYDYAVLPTIPFANITNKIVINVVCVYLHCAFANTNYYILSLPCDRTFFRCVVWACIINAAVVREVWEPGIEKAYTECNIESMQLNCSDHKICGPLHSPLETWRR